MVPFWSVETIPQTRDGTYVNRVELPVKIVLDHDASPKHQQV